MFTSYVFAQDCGVSMGTAVVLGDEIGPFFPDQQVGAAMLGDIIYFRFTVDQTGRFQHVNLEDWSGGLPVVFLPDGTTETIPLPDPLNPGYVETYYFGPFTLTTELLGKWDRDCDDNPVTTDADRVVAVGCINATCLQPAPVTDQKVQPRASVGIVQAPCIKITKEACNGDDPAFSKVSDDPASDVITYKYTVENCAVPITDPNTGATLIPAPLLQIVELLDSNPNLKVGGADTPDIGGQSNLLPAFIAAKGDDELAWDDAPVEFEATYKPVASDEPGPVTNTVDVNALNLDTAVIVGGELIFGEYVQDNANESVTLLHPSFTLDVTCEDGDIVAGEQVFDVNFCNTGDVPLDINPSIDDIAPFQLVNGECQSFEVKRSISGATVCDTGGSATLVVDANATIPSFFCGLSNVIDVDEASATCGVQPCDPNFTIEKTCLTTDCNELTTGDMAQYQIIITNTSTCYRGSRRRSACNR
jgi:hypothetical protein